MNEAHLRGPFAADSYPGPAQIRWAVMELVNERGLEETTVEMVVERADVDQATFADHFADLRDCCIKVYLANIDEFDRVVFGAADPREGWRGRLRATAYAAARWIEGRPLETRFDMIQMLSVGELAQAYRDRYVERIVDLIDEGRNELADPASLSRDVAVGVFGSIYQFLFKEMNGGQDLGVVDDLVPELMYIAVRPYVGHEAAKEELSVAAPPRGEHFE